MPNDQEWEDEHEWWEEYVDLCLECPTEPKENVYHVLPGYIPNIIAEAIRLERARIRKEVEEIAEQWEKDPIKRLYPLRFSADEVLKLIGE
jgi:hypothetical protein